MWQKAIPGVGRLIRKIEEMDRKIELLQAFTTLDGSDYDTLKNSRLTPAHWEVFDKPDPLVSVCVATYNREGLLMERCVPSILGQTHRNVELVVVGDHCTDGTFEKLARLAETDKRVRFLNLPTRGPYPERGDRRRWQMTGTQPFNTALAMSQGDFVCHLDDDDEYELDRVEKLVKLAQAGKFELVYHPFHVEDASGAWSVNPAREIAHGQVTSACAMYHRCLKDIPANFHAHLLDMPGDWHRFLRLKNMGVSHARHPDPLLRHYREGSQITDRGPP